MKGSIKSRESSFSPKFHPYSQIIATEKADRESDLRGKKKKGPF
jgi:hypothetical protein